MCPGSPNNQLAPFDANMVSQKTKLLIFFAIKEAQKNVCHLKLNWPPRNGVSEIVYHADQDYHYDYYYWRKAWTGQFSSWTLLL